MFDALIDTPLNPTPELTRQNTHKLIGYEQLQTAIAELADSINRDCLALFPDSLDKDAQDKPEIVLLCVMNGAMVFCSHLLPLLTFPLKFDSLQVSRYGDKDKGGELRWLKEPDMDLKGKHVLIVDDLIDEGASLMEIVSYCESKNVRSSRVAVLLNKNTQRRLPDAVVPDYSGLDIPDEFIFGFGIDYKNFYRNLLDIYAVKQS